MFTQKRQYSQYVNAPTFFDARLLNTFTREQLIEHAIKLSEYAQKLEGSK